MYCNMYTENDEFDIVLKVKNIFYSDTETFFRIMSATIMEQKGINGVKSYLKNEETVHLTIPLVDKGDTLKARVRVGRSDRYGHHLVVIGDYEMVEPQSEKELEEFLVRKFKGVGKKTAKTLIEAYGMDVMTTMLQDKDASTKLGMTEGRVKKLKATFSQHQSFEKLNSFLFGMHLPISIAIAIYDKLGADSLNQIQQNPYLITSFDYVSFTHADIVAHALKKDPLSPNRIKAGVIAFIEARMSEGDMCVSEERLYEEFTTFLNHKGNYQAYDNDRISHSLIEHAVSSLSNAQKIVKEVNRDKETYLYLKKFYLVENKLVQSLNELMTGFRPAIALGQEIEETLSELENKQAPLATLQRQAVFMALQNPFSILTGGPGTGKTHTVNTIVQTLKKINPGAKIALLAPTGLASKRMSDMTKMPAMTMHRKLNLSGFGSGEGITTIEEDFVIIDEVSMVDAELFNVLVSNISEYTRILLVGDVDQLPSIGPGLILKDLIDSKRVPVTMLTEVFRQAQNSQIVMNAHKLIKGKRTVDEDGIEIDHSKNDMFFVKSTDPEHVKHLILRSIQRQMEGYGRSIADICVLSPMRVGEIGTVVLNEEIQAMINPPHHEKNEIILNKDRKLIFREDDRVINLVNDVEKEVMNGETGYISSIHEAIHEDDNGNKKSMKVIEVTFPDAFEGDKVVEYTEGEFDNIELAYAISIHKSQGSEFPVVITPVHRTQERMLSRNLIYTAWTRAKSVLVIVGDEKQLDKGIDKIDGTDRVSLVKEKVQELLPPLPDASN